MNQKWLVDPDGIARIRTFVDEQKTNAWVKQRAARNLRADKPKVEKAVFWKQMVVCLLTSKQPSGPKAPVTRLTTTEPFPLDYARCLAQENLRAFASKLLTEFRCIRFVNRIPDFIATNLLELESGLWQKTMDQLEHVRLHQDRDTERKTAGFMRRHFRGIGPKQSRNLLQCLGLTKYEIPIDSRVTNKLSELGYPVQFSLNAERSYCRVLDDIQELCTACGVLPCILDASFFGGADGEGWTEENVKGVF